MAGTDGVLVVLDGSAQDVATLDWAVEEADALGSGLAVARLRSDSPAPDRAPARLAADGRRSQAAVLDVVAGRAAERAARMPVTIWDVFGTPLPALLRLAQESSRVVLGERRTGRMYHSLAGQVAAQTSRPVVVVRGRAGAAGPVIAHVSGAGPDQLVLGDAFEYARRRQLPLRALHTYRTAHVDPSGHAAALPPAGGRDRDGRGGGRAVGPDLPRRAGRIRRSPRPRGGPTARSQCRRRPAGCGRSWRRRPARRVARADHSGSHPPRALPGSDRSLTGAIRRLRRGPWTLPVDHRRREAEGMTTTVPATTTDGWDALLSDGGVVRIRLATEADDSRLRALHEAASDRSIYLRYFSLNRRTGDWYVDKVLHGGTKEIVLIAEEHGTVVGMAGCTRLGRTADAEVALLVADSHQRRGVGTLLLEHLAAVARQAGIRSFVADTLADNGLMQQVFTDAGFQLERRGELDVTHVRMSLAPTPQAQNAVDLRERSADVASLRHVLAPNSIVVVGASDRPGSVGGAVLHNIIAGHYPGILRAVNPNRRWVQRLRAYPSVLALPEPVDLAIVAVPGPAVEQVIRDCGERGIPAAVILSAGFGETDTDGADRERQLLRTARAAGVRLVGPNCLGVAVRTAGTRLNATFGAASPPPGAVGIASQSGALGIGLLAEATHRHIGVSGFVSLGNKLDVSGNDLLLYWENDRATKVIALYLESFGNPAKFLRHARRIARSKPIVALKAGRTAAGARAGASHTAAAATPDVVVTTLLQPGRGDPGPQHRGTTRRRATAVRTTRPGRQAPRHHRQRRRTRHPRRRRHRRHRPRGPRTLPRHPGRPARRRAGPRLGSEPDRPRRGRRRRRVRADHPGAAGLR